MVADRWIYTIVLRYPYHYVSTCQSAVVNELLCLVTFREVHEPLPFPTHFAITDHYVDESFCLQLNWLFMRLD